MLRIAVLGGGVSGLSCCYFLKKIFGSQAELKLFEAEARVGGWVQTIELGGSLCELGARSLRTKGSGVKTLELIEELGLEEQLLTNSKQARLRYLWQAGKLHQLPATICQLLFSKLTRQFLPQLMQEIVRKEKRAAVFDGALDDDESIYDFFTRRFSRELTECLIDPMMSGIYAGDIRKLSLKACCPTFYRWQTEYGSLLKGALFSKRLGSTQRQTPFLQKMQKAQMVSFKGGMELLIRAFESRLEGMIERQKRCIGLKNECTGKAITLSFADGTSFVFDHVVSALPVKALKVFFKEDSAVLPLLEGFSTTSLLVINAIWQKPLLAKEGFGYLVASREKQPLLGVIWDSSAFPWHNSSQAQTRLSLMMGGSHRPDLVELDDEAVLKLALNCLKDHLNIEKEPDHLYLHRAVGAIPQYTVGHLQRVEQLRGFLKQKQPRLELIGNSFDGVSISDCIESGRRSAQAVFSAADQLANK